MAISITKDDLISCELEAWLAEKTKSIKFIYAVAFDAYSTLASQIDNGQTATYKLHHALTVSGQPEIFYPSIAAVQELQNA